MKTRINTAIMGLFALAIAAFIAIGCEQPTNSSKPAQTGTISGRALFSNSDSHGGIAVTLEKTDGARSLSAIAAARSLEQGLYSARSFGTARTLAGQTTTGADGSFSFAGLEAGTYTIYATSADSKERAVYINKNLAASQSIDDIIMNLTAVGSIGGAINVDEGGNHGYLVSVAGTSYMAATGTDGSFIISDVPEGSGYYIIVMKGLYTDFWHGGVTPQTVSVTRSNTTNLSTKTIKYEDVISGGIVIEIGANGNWYINGKDTGKPSQGKDGVSPTFAVSEDGYWIINGVTTGFKAAGEDGRTPVITIVGGFWYIDGVTTGISAIGQKGEDGHTPVVTIVGGYWYVDGVTTGISAIGQKGDDGHTPVITIEGGFWYVDGVTTGVSAIGQKGEDGHTPVITIVGGFWCVDGVSTGVKAEGEDGTTPHIGDNGNWWIGTTDTSVKALGEDGTTPHIGDNGNWWIGSTDTGVLAGPQEHPQLIVIMPTKTIYDVNEAFESAGLAVQVSFADYLSPPLTAGLSLSWNNSSLINGDTDITARPGIKTITITHAGRSADFDITVSNNIRVMNTDHWNTALTIITEGGNNQNYTIIVNGNVSVGGTTVNTFGTVANVMVTLHGNGRLYLTSRGSILNISNNQTLIIDSAELTLEGLRNGQNGSTLDNTRSVIGITGSSSMIELRNGIIANNTNANSGTVTAGGVSASHFIMSGGSINNNISVMGAGGVHVGNSFVMTGGEICNNTITESNSGGVGGGVYAMGHFIMSGGVISGNSSYWGGAGVYFGGTHGLRIFEMAGGEISNNTTTRLEGHAVWISGSDFIMSAGSIINNSGGGVGLYQRTMYGGSGMTVYPASFTMESGTISSNTLGVGVRVGGSDTSLIMKGDSTISDNNSGGVEVSGGGSFTMESGTISGNTTLGGVYINSSNGVFVKSGGIIYGNEVIPATLRNISTAYGNGHTVFWNRDIVDGGPLFRNTTLYVVNNISTDNPNGWGL
ncbi:MAG: hypothetical protein FWG99_06120 [Treponema sp.]|nr:hypothetical protein [Treponema sp.]